MTEKQLDQYMKDLDRRLIARMFAEAEANKDKPEPVLPEGTHDCMDNAVPYVSDGPLGHGWECGICGSFLQAG